MIRRSAVDEIRAFNRFYTNIIGVVDRHILDSPYSLTEVRVLWEIFHKPGCTARDIRRILAVDEGYLSRSIAKLVELDLVRRRRRDSDARSFALSLSDKGRRIFLGLDRRSSDAIAAMTRAVSDEELAEVVGHMQRIKAILGRIGDGP